MTDEENQDYFTKKYTEPCGEKMRGNLGLTSEIDIDLTNIKFCKCGRGKLMDKHFKLCLVLDNQAWFTTQDVKLQWGDDWDDAPYEHNAGPPYEYHEDMDCLPYEIKKVYWESNYWMIPNRLGKDESVETINDRGFWLAHYHGSTFDEMLPETTLENFKKMVNVYELTTDGR